MKRRDLNGRLPGRWARPVVFVLPVAILLHEAVGWLTQGHWEPGDVPMPNALYAPADFEMDAVHSRAIV